MSSRVDQAIAGNPFCIDESQCSFAAEVLRLYTPSPSRPKMSETDSRETELLFKVFFIAICHNINWDFLQKQLAAYLVSPEPAQLMAKASATTAKEISEILASYAKPERIRAAERAAILRDTASILQDDKSLTMRLLSARRALGTGGFIELISRLPAFAEDPLKKKAFILAQELAREGVVRFDDEDQLRPAIDYHLIRLYLRTGRVYWTAPIVERVFRSESAPPLRLVTLLRTAVSDALNLTAFYAKRSVLEVNYFEWQIARQRCEREFTNCAAPWPDPLFDKEIVRISPTACPNKGWCAAFNDSNWATLREPSIRKAFY